MPPAESLAASLRISVGCESILARAVRLAITIWLIAIVARIAIIRRAGS